MKIEISTTVPEYFKNIHQKYVNTLCKAPNFLDYVSATVPKEFFESHKHIYQAAYEVRMKTGLKGILPAYIYDNSNVVDDPNSVEKTVNIISFDRKTEILIKHHSYDRNDFIYQERRFTRGGVSKYIIDIMTGFIYDQQLRKIDKKEKLTKFLIDRFDYEAIIDQFKNNCLIDNYIQSIDLVKDKQEFEYYKLWLTFHKNFI